MGCSVPINTKEAKNIYYNKLSIFELIYGVTDPDWTDDSDDIDPELARLDKADFELKQYYEDRIRR